MDKDVDQFWRDEEKKLGKTIRSRALGRILSVNHTGTIHPWALFFTTDETLYVKTFPSQNWLLSLLRSSPEEAPEYEFIIPGTAILTKEYHPAQKTLFSTQLPQIRITWDDPEDKRQLFFLFEVEENAEEQPA